MPSFFLQLFSKLVNLHSHFEVAKTQMNVISGKATYHGAKNGNKKKDVPTAQTKMK
jgi:hypothetical protein